MGLAVEQGNRERSGPAVKRLAAGGNALKRV